MMPSHSLMRQATPTHRTPLDWHKKVLALAGPMMVAGVTVPLVGLVDTAVIGRLPEPTYLGAVAVGATIFNAVFWMFGFLRMSTTALSAQARGAGDTPELIGIVCRAGATALMLAMLVVSLQGPVFDAALHLLEATSDVEGLARSYCDTRVWGVPAVLVNFVVLGALFGLQDVRSVLLLGGVLNLSNVALDLCFVVLLGWDVQGVAAGTAISEWLATCLGLGLLWRHVHAREGHHVVWRSILDRASFKSLFGVSRDLILRSFLVQLPFFVFTVLGASLGDTVLAANAVLMQLFFFMAFGLNSFAHVSETLVGNAVGARNPAELRSATAFTSCWSLIFALGISGTYLAAGGLIVDGLTDLSQVRYTARLYLPWMAVAPLLAAGAFQLDGIYIGAAQTRHLRNTMFISVLAFAATLWVTFDALGNHGLWLALVIFLALRTLMLTAFFPAMVRNAVAPSTRCRIRSSAVD